MRYNEAKAILKLWHFNITLEVLFAWLLFLLDCHSGEFLDIKMEAHRTICMGWGKVSASHGKHGAVAALPWPGWLQTATYWEVEGGGELVKQVLCKLTSSLSSAPASVVALHQLCCHLTSPPLHHRKPVAAGGQLSAATPPHPTVLYCYHCSGSLAVVPGCPRLMLGLLNWQCFFSTSFSRIILESHTR